MISRNEIIIGSSLTSGWYLENNSDFSEQLLTTLNQVDGLDPNGLKFCIDFNDWTYDYWISNNYFKDNKVFEIKNKNLAIKSKNWEDLLNISTYEKLIVLTKTPLNKGQWIYFPNDKTISFWISSNINKYNILFNVKLNKSINEYQDKDFKIIAHFVNDVRQLLFDDNNYILLNQFNYRWKNMFIDKRYVIRDIGITFLIFNSRYYVYFQARYDYIIKHKDNKAQDYANLNQFWHVELEYTLDEESKLWKFLKTHNLSKQLKGLDLIDMKGLNLF